MLIMRYLLPILVGLAVCSCAQVPKQSVELSSTVGRDIAAVHKAHTELAHILFQRMRQDINQFVDSFYAPSVIRSVMELDREYAISESQDDRKKSLVLAINSAFKPGASPEQQDKVFRAMGTFVGEIRRDIEEMRRELLDPLYAQEDEVIHSINRAYQQLHYANSIVTGYLSSVVEVNETQAELLEAIGVEQDLRTKVSEGLAKASHDIGKLMDIATMGEGTIRDVKDNANKIKEAVKKLGIGPESKPNGGKND